MKFAGTYSRVVAGAGKKCGYGSALLVTKSDPCPHENSSGFATLVKNNFLNNKVPWKPVLWNRFFAKWMHYHLSVSFLCIGSSQIGPPMWKLRGKQFVTKQGYEVMKGTSILMQNYYAAGSSSDTDPQPLNLSFSNPDPERKLFPERDCSIRFESNFFHQLICPRP